MGEVAQQILVEVEALTTVAAFRPVHHTFAEEVRVGVVGALRLVETVAEPAAMAAAPEQPGGTAAALAEPPLWPTAAVD